MAKVGEGQQEGRGSDHSMQIFFIAITFPHCCFFSRAGCLKVSVRTAGCLEVSVRT